MPASLKNLLLSGQSVIGVLTPCSDPAQAELLTLLGWDLLIFDSEHGPLGTRDLHDLVRAVQTRGGSALVRTPGRDPHVVTRFLESGAAGLMAPMIDSGEAARLLVSACRYPPLGVRGVSGSRATNFGVSGNFADHLTTANADMLIVAQIETAAAVECADDIASVDGVDVVFIGPADLSASLGHPMDFDHPVVKKAIATAAEAVLGAGKKLGLLVTHPKQIDAAKALGVTFALVYADAILGQGSAAFLKAFRQPVPAGPT